MTKFFEGFTLIELVIIIIMAGILSIVAVPIYRTYINRNVKLYNDSKRISKNLDVKYNEYMFYRRDGKTYNEKAKIKIITGTNDIELESDLNRFCADKIIFDIIINSDSSRIYIIIIYGEY